MIFNPSDRTTYLIANDSLVKQSQNYFRAPFYILKEELWGSHHVKWVKVTSAENPIEECEKYPRFIRVVLAVTFLIPGIVCATLTRVIFGLSYKESILRNHLIYTGVIFGLSYKESILRKHLIYANTNRNQFPLANLSASTTSQSPPVDQLNILSLPEEILLKLFHVAVNQDPKTRAAVSKVSKYFHILANDPTTWTSTLSDIGITFTQANFAEYRPHILIRYRDMATNSDIKAHNLIFRSLFEDQQAFSKLPIVFMDDLVDYNDTKIQISSEQLTFLDLFSFSFQKAQPHRMALIISARGCMGLFMKCQSLLSEPFTNPTETSLIITPIQMNDREMGLTGNTVYRYSTGKSYDAFVDFSNPDLNVQIQAIKDLLAGKPCEFFSDSHFSNDWNSLNWKLQLLNNEVESPV